MGRELWFSLLQIRQSNSVKVEMRLGPFLCRNNSGFHEFYSVCICHVYCLLSRHYWLRWCISHLYNTLLEKMGSEVFFFNGIQTVSMIMNESNVHSLLTTVNKISLVYHTLSVANGIEGRVFTFVYVFYIYLKSNEDKNRKGKIGFEK